MMSSAVCEMSGAWGLAGPPPQSNAATINGTALSAGLTLAIDTSPHMTVVQVSRPTRARGGDGRANHKEVVLRSGVSEIALSLQGAALAPLRDAVLLPLSK